MQNWIIAKAKYLKQDEFGKLKNVLEPFLIDALSMTEAEAKLTENLKEIAKGDILIAGITKANFSEVVTNETCGHYWKVRISYTADDKGKKVNNNVLIEAESAEQALQATKELFKNMLVTWEIENIARSPIVEVWHHISPPEATESNDTENSESGD